MSLGLTWVKTDKKVDKISGEIVSFSVLLFFQSYCLFSQREGVERYISELRAIDLRSSLIQFSQVLFPFPNNAIGSRECWFHAYSKYHFGLTRASFYL